MSASHVTAIPTIVNHSNKSEVKLVCEYLLDEKSSSDRELYGCAVINGKVRCLDHKPIPRCVKQLRNAILSYSGLYNSCEFARLNIGQTIYPSSSIYGTCETHIILSDCTIMFHEGESIDMKSGMGFVLSQKARYQCKYTIKNINSNDSDVIIIMFRMLSF